MVNTFDFHREKTAQENIADFLTFIEAEEPLFGGLLRAHVGKLVPLPDGNRRSAARAAFNSEIRKHLETILATEATDHA
jgi:hypothetical protein